MKSSIIIFLFIIAFMGCSKENPDDVSAGTVIEELNKNEMYKKFKGFMIVARDRENAYFLGIDSLNIYPWVGLRNNKVVIDESTLKYIKDSVKNKYYSNFDDLINNLIQKSTELILFMNRNDIKAVYGNYPDTSDVTLDLMLYNKQKIFLIAKNFDEKKKRLEKNYDYIGRNKNWMIVKEKNK